MLSDLVCVSYTEDCYNREVLVALDIYHLLCIIPYFSHYRITHTGGIRSILCNAKA